MLSVMIADDEIAIVYLIKKLIHWQDLGMECIGTAANGQEALALAREKKPDIIITDIQMPGLTGLELIEHLKPELPDTSFIIVSGYQEFEYAKQAIRFGVEDYLLKPIKEKEINNILGRIQNRCEKKNEELRERQVLKQEKILARKRFLMTQMETAVPGSINRDLFSFPRDCRYMALSFAVDPIDRESQQKEMESLAEIILEWFVSEFRDLFVDMEAIQLSNGYHVVFTNMPEDIQANGRKFSKQLTDFINRVHIKYQCKLTLVWVKGLEEHLISEGLAQQINRRMLERFYQGQGELLLEEYDGNVVLSEGSELTEPQKMTLIRLLDSGDEDELCAWIRDTMAELQEVESERLWLQILLAKNICATLAMGFKQLGISDDRIVSMADHWNYHLCFCHTYRILELSLEKLGVDYLTLRDEYRKSEVSAPIRKAKQFINQHYSEPISMEEVADHVFLSPNYFSGLFKKSTGMNFLEYLTGIRMEKAKELLMDDSISIAEVAFRVGYADARHFSKMFIKNIGIRPAEYRKIHI